MPQKTRKLTKKSTTISNTRKVIVRGKYTYDELYSRFNDGKIFTVTFIKKNGEERVMNARLGVKKHLRGGDISYNPKEKNLLPVFDIQKQEYRMINIDTIVSVKGHNQLEIIKP